MTVNLDEGMQKIIGWGHPALIFEFRSGKVIFLLNALLKLFQRDSINV
jgi:hypothetical protein